MNKQGENVMRNMKTLKYTLKHICKIYIQFFVANALSKAPEVIFETSNKSSHFPYFLKIFLCQPNFWKQAFLKVQLHMPYLPSNE